MGDLRRRSIFNSMAISSPLRKGNGNNQASPLNDTLLNESNDEIERSNRRSNAEIQRRVSNIADSSYRKEAQRLFDRNEVNSHFQICMKLHSENKITMKNVWKLFITDILPQVVSNSPNVLQIAGISLDISAKVYGLRVDSLHEEGIKLANVISKFVEKSSKDNDDDIHEENDNNSNGKRKGNKKKRIFSKKSRATILPSDSPNLFGDLPKLESVFFSIPEDSDISSTQNLFTNRLPMHPLGHKFLLLNNEKHWKREISKDDKTKFAITLIKPNSFLLCKSFIKFTLNEWDPDEEDTQFGTKQSQGINDELILDENGIPIPELDGSLHDVFANDNANENDLDDDIMDVHEPKQMEEFNREIFLSNNDVYNSIINSDSVQIFNQLWAGPSHWKVKFIRPSKSTYSGSVDSEQIITKTNRKQNKSPAVIDFFANDFDGKNLNINKHNLILNKKRTPPDLSKITLLAPCFDFKEYLISLNQFENKMGLRPVKKATNDNLEYKVSAYNYDNPNDSQYCAQQNIDNDSDNNDNHDGDEFDEGIVQERIDEAQVFLGENLVNAPESVPDSYIPFALKAKTIDMKKLKSATWNILTNKANDRNVDEEPNISMQFSDLYKALPKHLNEKMNENLSVSQAFISTLFLCNEHNLKLTQENSSDFWIKN